MRKVFLTHGFQIFENFETSQFCIFKNYDVKYVERYIQEERTQKKVSLKNTLYFEKYKKDKFQTKRYTILLLFYYY
jgi:hypothetical protein